MANKKVPISLWVGQAPSPDALEAYLERLYTEDGDRMPSEFMTDFAIRRFDEDRREAWVTAGKEVLLSEMLKGCSYEESVIPALV